eukprot:g2635.t1
MSTRIGEHAAASKLLDLELMSAAYESIDVIGAEVYLEQHSSVDSSVFFLDEGRSTCPVDYTSRRDFGYYQYRSYADGRVTCDYSGASLLLREHECLDIEALGIEYADHPTLALLLLDKAKTSESILLNGFLRVPPEQKNDPVFHRERQFFNPSPSLQQLVDLYMAHELKGRPYISVYWNQGSFDPHPRPHLYTGTKQLARYLRQETAYRELGSLFLVTDATLDVVELLREELKADDPAYSIASNSGSGITVNVFNGTSVHSTATASGVELHSLAVALVELEIAARGAYFLGDMVGDMTMHITFDRHSLGIPEHHDGRFGGPDGNYFHWAKEEAGEREGLVVRSEL